MKICKNCPSRKGSRCGECGCVLKLKTKCLSCECPLKKWLAQLDEEQEDVIDKYNEENN